MIAGDRLPLLTFGVSILIHLLLVLSLSRWPWQQPRPAAHRATQYVMRFHQPAPTPTPVFTPVAAATPTPVQPLASPLPDVQPRRPSELQPPRPKAAVVKPRPPVQVNPSPPRRPSVVAPKQAPTRVEAVTPQAVQPVPDQVAKLAPPRPPVTDWQQTVPSQSPSANADPDALQAYLNLIVQTLEKHKRYPKYAKRRALKGRVVLQFVILPDGQVINPQIAKSTGHQSFRTAALRAFSRAVPMPPFPPDLQRRKLAVEVPISYQIKTR